MMGPGATGLLWLTWPASPAPKRPPARNHRSRRRTTRGGQGAARSTAGPRASILRGPRSSHGEKAASLPMPHSLCCRRWSPGYGSARPTRRRTSLSRPARVVRVAPLHIRSDRLAELRRILGDDVEVTETTLTEPDAVEAIASSIGADRRGDRRPGTARPRRPRRSPRRVHGPAAAVRTHPHEPRRAPAGLRRIRRPYS